MDRVTSVTSRLASVIVDVVEFRRVWDRIKSIIRNKTDKCSEHNPKIGPLTDLTHYTLDDIVAISLLRREVATKMTPKTGGFATRHR